MKTELGWDDSTIKSERRRVSRLIPQQIQAGSKYDNEKLAEELATAEKLEATKGKKLDADIAKKKAERAELTKTVERLKTKKSHVEHARDDLRNLLPPHVLEAYNKQKRHLNDTLRRAYFNEKTELDHKIALVSPDNASDSRSYRELVRAFDRSAVDADGQFTPGWHDRVAAIREEIPQQEENVNVLQAEYETALSQVEALKNYYLY